MPQITRTDSLAVAGWGADGSQKVINRYSQLIRLAHDRLKLNLNRNDWNVLAEVVGPCGDFEEIIPCPNSYRYLLRLSLEEQINREDVQDLILKWDKVDDLGAEAIVAALRWFWSHADQIDMESDEWWTPEFRASH